MVFVDYFHEKNRKIICKPLNTKGVVPEILVMNTNNPFSPANPDVSNIVITRTTDSISTQLDSETVVLNITSGTYCGLDQVGTTVWNQLEHPATFSQLIDRILSEYDVTREHCISDLCSFLKELLDNKLIEFDGEKIS